MEFEQCQQFAMSKGYNVVINTDDDCRVYDILDSEGEYIDTRYSFAGAWKYAYNLAKMNC